jgi:hypothetical protein
MGLTGVNGGQTNSTYNNGIGPSGPSSDGTGADGDEFEKQASNAGGSGPYVGTDPNQLEGQAETDYKNASYSASQGDNQDAGKYEQEGDQYRQQAIIQKAVQDNTNSDGSVDQQGAVQEALQGDAATVSHQVASTVQDLVEGDLPQFGLDAQSGIDFEKYADQILGTAPQTSSGGSTGAPGASTTNSQPGASNTGATTPNGPNTVVQGLGGQTQTIT